MINVSLLLHYFFKFVHIIVGHAVALDEAHKMYTFRRDMKMAVEV